MIDEASHKPSSRRRGSSSTATSLPAPGAPTTREQQRQNTRRAILDATVACLVEEGYGTLTTRRIAERVGIAQSTLMHHFETREALLVEAVSNLAVTLADTAVQQLDLTTLSGDVHREAVLDQAWATFTSPEALAAAQLWGAAWTEPELAAALRDLEIRVAEIVLHTAVTVFPEESTDPAFAVYIDGVFQMIRGLIMAIPTWGKDAVDVRWSLLRPVIVTASGALIPSRD